MGRTSAIETDMTRLKPFSITDPALNAAVTTDILDNFSCVIITTTAAGNAQTLATPTVTTDVKRFSVINNDSSTHSITVNGQVVSPGETIYFIWDLTSWVENIIDLTGGVSGQLPIENGGTGVLTGVPRVGDWLLQAYSANYQATSDGFVFFRSNGASNNTSSTVVIRGYVGTSNPANTFVMGDSFVGGPQTLNCSIIFPVKAGEWYRCSVITDTTGTSFFQSYFIPLV